MKLIIAILIFIPSYVICQFYPRNQLLVAGEYFINTDPGQGNGTPISANYNQPETDIEFIVTLSENDILFFRVKSSNGKWSDNYAIIKSVSNAPYAYLVSGEYFKGNDPGIGQGTSFDISPLGNFEITSLNLSRNEWLFIRVKDSYERWSSTYAIQYRWKDITKASYYIKYANGTVTSEQIMSIQNIPSNSPFFVANSDNISQTTSRDTVFVQVQTDEYFLSGWYKTSGQVTTSIDEEFIPDKFKLYDLYPNPFNNSTTLEFDLPESQEITIEICDLLGRRILQIFKNEFFYPGKHRFNLNLTELTSGVYFLIFKSQKINEIKKLVLLK